MEKLNDLDKKQILLRLSPKLWQEIAAWAEVDFRSINGQIEYLLTECVRQRRKTRKDNTGPFSREEASE
jgi:hypothetical protein